MTKILITVDCGYIGSHKLLELLNVGNEVVVCDNLFNLVASFSIFVSVQKSMSFVNITEINLFS